MVFKIETIAIITFTDNGEKIADKLKSEFDCTGKNDKVKLNKDKLDKDKFDKDKFDKVKEAKKSDKDKFYLSLNATFKVDIFNDRKNNSKMMGDIFSNYDYIIFVSAVGIAVRFISPHVSDKLKDPGVVVVDDRENFAISLLSGHLGGANELSKKVASVIGAMPVVTTATDVNKKTSIDLIMKRLNARLILEDGKSDTTYKFSSEDIRYIIKFINSALISEKKHVYIINDGYKIDTRGMIEIGKDEVEEIIKDKTYENYLVIVSNQASVHKVDSSGFKNIIHVYPRDVVVGIGCRRDTSIADLKNALAEILSSNDLAFESIGLFTSINIKSDEKAIIELSEEIGVGFKTYPKEELQKFDRLFKGSDFVREKVGVSSVSGASCFAASDKGMICNPTKFKGIVLALGICDTIERKDL